MTMKFMTDPYGRVPQHTLLETRFLGGFRYGGEKSNEEREYDRWWRQKVASIIRS